MHRVAVIEGEDAAPEAVRPTLEVVEATGAAVEWLPVDPADADAARTAIDSAHTTLFGATSGPSARLLFYLRWGKRTYANVRPIHWMPGAASPLADPTDIDFVIVRENLEDLYVGLEGDVEDLAPLDLRDRRRQPVHELGPGRWALKVLTGDGTRRVARAAFALAEQRAADGGPGRVTVGTKHNMLHRSDGYFRDVCLEVAAEHPAIEVDTPLVDDLARRMVAEPRTLDVVLLPNLYGDILSDAAAGLIGGLGMAPSGCYGDDYAYFEPSHGTAPDLAGRDVINPTAQMLSAALMLDHLGDADAAHRIRFALAAVFADGLHLTPDQGGRATTRRFTDAVLEELAR